jgi:LPXTG-motif cell wall-anchored protein
MRVAPGLQVTRAGMMQAQPTPLEFVPREHTDLIFQVHVTSWPVLLAAIGGAALALGLLVYWWRRRRRDEP